MRIAINTRLMIPGRLDGIGWFTYETVRRIAQEHPEHEFFLLFDRRPPAQYQFSPNTHLVHLHPQARLPILWLIFFECSVARKLRRLRADLFISTDGWIALRSTIPTLTVIHDINFEHEDGYVRPSHQRYFRTFFPRYAQHANRIATVSEFSKSDIATHYRLTPEKIDVVYDGAHADYHPLTDKEQQTVRQEYTDGCRYFLFVGTISRRKNLAGVLSAFEWVRNHSIERTQLVVVGARTWWPAEMEQLLQSLQYRDEVRFLGRCDSQCLARLMASAEVLVYPSFFEGFGIPIIEAFQSGVPVITSNCTSMPEIADNAALLVDPYNTDEIATAMLTLLNNPTERQRLINLGHKRAQAFSWDRTSRLLWESALKILSRQ
ncbi:MAG: glycosyltransferase family 4 protein [Bacteroidales bacterium]|nr:glycosyltransferase family 4 protein [Bacteroidales bacterium]MBQ9639931.1 glycosyltransferase family 4 protein [Bacteroidales bacterium]